MRMLQQHKRLTQIHYLSHLNDFECNYRIIL
jgi:hypothetical protein